MVVTPEEGVIYVKIYIYQYIFRKLPFTREENKTQEVAANSILLTSNR